MECGMYSITLLLCGVSLSLSEITNEAIQKGYVKNEETGQSYRLVTKAETWFRAKEICEEELATLAVPKTQAEFNFIQKLVRSMKFQTVEDSDYKLLVWLGIYYMDDFTTWKNIFGENIEASSFHTWIKGNGEISKNPSEPHCAGLDAMSPSLRDFWCHRKEPFMCQLKI